MIKIINGADRIKKAHEFELAVEKAKAAGEGYSAGKQSVTDCNHLEQAVVRENRTSQESRQVGNAAAMREALEELIYGWDIFINGMEEDLDGHYPAHYQARRSDYEKRIHKAKSALSALPRYCDVMSLELAKKLWFTKEIVPILTGDLPAGKEIPFEEWFVSQLEQGAKGDAK